METINYHKVGVRSILVAFFFFPVVVFSQNISTSMLVWEADQYTDLQSQKETPYKGIFKTNMESVEWIQNDGQRNSLYTVQGTEGTWVDISANGSLTYLLVRNDKSSRMTVEKSDTGTFILFDFSQPGESTFKIRFRIRSVQTNH